MNGNNNFTNTVAAIIALIVIVAGLAIIQFGNQTNANIVSNFVMLVLGFYFGSSTDKKGNGSISYPDSFPSKDSAPVLPEPSTDTTVKPIPTIEEIK